MSEIPESLRLLFETSIERADDGYVLPISSEHVENGSLSTAEIYRIAVLTNQGVSSPASDETGQSTADSSSRTTDSSDNRASKQEPPVTEGEIRSVTIDTLGDQGDGIAKVERGFIVIVSGTQPGDQAEVEITDVQETVAFAEPINDPTVR